MAKVLGGVSLLLVGFLVALGGYSGVIAQDTDTPTMTPWPTYTPSLTPSPMPSPAYVTATPGGSSELFPTDENGCPDWSYLGEGTVTPAFNDVSMDYAMDCGHCLASGSSVIGGGVIAVPVVNTPAGSGGGPVMLLSDVEESLFSPYSYVSFYMAPEWGVDWLSWPQLGSYFTLAGAAFDDLEVVGLLFDVEVIQGSGHARALGSSSGLVRDSFWMDDGVSYCVGIHAACDAVGAASREKYYANVVTVERALEGFQAEGVGSMVEGRLNNIDFIVREGSAPLQIVGTDVPLPTSTPVPTATDIPAQAVCVFTSVTSTGTVNKGTKNTWFINSARVAYEWDFTHTGGSWPEYTGAWGVDVDCTAPIETITFALRAMEGTQGQTNKNWSCDDNLAILRVNGRVWGSTIYHDKDYIANADWWVGDDHYVRYDYTNSDPRGWEILGIAGRGRGCNNGGYEHYGAYVDIVEIDGVAVLQPDAPVATPTPTPTITPTPFWGTIEDCSVVEWRSGADGSDVLTWDWGGWLSEPECYTFIPHIDETIPLASIPFLGLDDVSLAFPGFEICLQFVDFPSFSVLGLSVHLDWFLVGLLVFLAGWLIRM